MESVSALVYCNGDMIPTDERIVFECPTDLKFITISEDMSLAALRKLIFYTNGGWRILVNVFLPSTKLLRWWLCSIRLYGAQTRRWCQKNVFSSIANLVPKVRLSWMQLLDILQMKSLPKCTNQGNQEWLMI